MFKLTVALMTATMALLLAACNNGDLPAEPTDTPAPPDELSEAIETVAIYLGPNELGIEKDDLVSIANPKGDGTFVYVKQTRFSGVERFIIWLVLDGTAYALNGATESVIPPLDQTRFAGPTVWAPTGLGQFQTTEAFEIIFGVPVDTSATPPPPVATGLFGSEVVPGGAVEGVWYVEVAVMRAGAPWYFCLELNEGAPSGEGTPLSGTLYGRGEEQSVTGWLDPHVRASTLPSTFTFGYDDLTYWGTLETLGASGWMGNDPFSTGAVPVGGLWLAVRSDRDFCK